MDSRKQIYFRDTVLKDYPNTGKFFTDLTGNERARAFLAAMEAFMAMTSSADRSARSVYHLAESLREDGIVLSVSAKSSVVNSTEDGAEDSPVMPKIPVESDAEAAIIDDEYETLDDLNKIFNPPENK